MITMTTTRVESGKMMSSEELSTFRVIAGRVSRALVMRPKELAEVVVKDVNTVLFSVPTQRAHLRVSS